MSTQPTPVIPDPTPTSQPFWDALAEGRVDIQRCDDCGTWVWYPRSRCSGCLSPNLTWTTVSGEGVVYTFTVARQPTNPNFAGSDNLILAVVTLAEGPRITTTLEGVAPDEAEVGMTVVPCIVATDGGPPLLRFQPA